ncbi:DUF6082 family protein [Streptomyces sp. NBC_01481]|uniref:DUF6082 family protein n=1 Tax=Streptomyces sp. NBC_01481 TaxID=2975869 RepID=UPI0022523C12|nr:DUF6082 family protein [Streptomyces sp. NBC_01481]MCX4587896.1 DUF6082 family protein [Streptomyces sp. NBC_01481]
MTTQGSAQRGVAVGVAVVIVCAIAVIGLVATLSLAISVTMNELAPDTDVSAANAVFSGLAFGAVIVALVIQHQQMHRHNGNLSTQLAHMEQANGLQRRADITNQQRLHFELLSKAMDDPDLAAVLDTYDTRLSPVKQRQYLYANALYQHVLHAYRIGAATEDDVRGHLRVICRNPIFREFWAATRSHRASVRYESQEAYLGRLVDRLIIRHEEEGRDWWAD